MCVCGPGISYVVGTKCSKVTVILPSKTWSWINIFAYISIFLSQNVVLTQSLPLNHEGMDTERFLMVLSMEVEFTGMASGKLALDKTGISTIAEEHMQPQFKILPDFQLILG